ncbi:MAG: hypothetical protein EXR43_03165, partial [Dehalococcoidia bacterium]|nr:hypothetical protein [Dehalococcoidia bacterium]
MEIDAVSETTTTPEAPSPLAPAIPEVVPSTLPVIDPEADKLHRTREQPGKALYREILPGVIQMPADLLLAMSR